MDMVFLVTIWAVVWGPDAVDAWRKWRTRKHDVTDLMEVTYVDDIDWSRK